MKSKEQIRNILIIIIILCNIILFAVPINHNNVFWTSYLFTILACVSQFFIWDNAFSNARTIKSKFTGLPIISVGSIYIIVQFIACYFILTSPEIQNWLAIITYSIILCLSLICLISTDLAKDEVIRVEEKIKAKTSFTKSTNADLEILILNEENVEIKSALTKLLEQVKYSDPVSSDELFELENQIKNKISEISTSAEKLNIINELEKLILERNTKCKYLK